ncbi:MAG: diguanylate cyclase [Oscillospiraceae bacterium]|nr:diguanylate cyclase [Oscillospiraceae bacterium]
MLKNQETSQTDMRRQILIVDDEEINREILGDAVNNDYDLLYAADGREALELIRANSRTLSLVLLDLIMPRMNGLELLRIKRTDPKIRDIPVIVVTSDRMAEVESFTLGALDFIPKPYPRLEVILARVRRAIELYEGRHITLSTGRDALAILSGGYERIYYVDLSTGQYTVFNFCGVDTTLHTDGSGEDFYADCLRIIEQEVYEEDRERLRRAIPKDALLSRLSETGRCTALYRLLVGGVPTYYSFKAVLVGGDDHSRAIVGVRNVDSEIRSARRIGETSGFTPDFTGLAKALSRDIESVYYVDIETDSYMGYFSDGAYSLLEMESDGTDFFGDCQRDLQHVVYSEDMEKVSNALDKQTLLKALADRQSFSMDYRLVIEDRPQYYRMKVIPAETGAFRHIIVGVSNVDAQITEEQRLAAEQMNLMSITRVAQALARDFLNIYYVDVETDYFIEFSPESIFSSIGIESRGEDFFAISRQNMPRFVHPEDLSGFMRFFTKDNVLRELELHGSLSYSYRMVLGGESRYVMMKAARLDDRHIVIGTSDINEEMQRKKDALVRSGVAQALSSDYFLIYYVDTETDRFIEYRSAEEKTELDIESGGENFFNVARGFLRNVSVGDQEKVESVLDKERLLELLEETGSYTQEYSMMYHGALTYVHMKASRMADRADPHIVIGLSNISARVRREKEQALALQKATELASRDALTGVKSKRVFVEAEAEWDERIEAEPDIAFTIAMFDLNGLKYTNDTFGHAAGDDYIRRACKLICDTFDHSPVYRVGGDEFSAILTGTDYAQRNELKARFRAASTGNVRDGDVVVACGMSDYIPGQDKRFQDVFERADADMYENKKRLKFER